MSKRDQKHFDIPTAPSETTYETLLSEDFSVENGGGFRTDVSMSNQTRKVNAGVTGIAATPTPVVSVTPQTVQCAPVAAEGMVEDSIEDMIDDPTPEVVAAVASVTAAQPDPVPEKPVFEREQIITSAPVERPNPEKSAESLKKRMQSSGVPEKNDFACFHEVYSSRDGKLCVYEDAEGHIMAVDAAKLA